MSKPTETKLVYGSDGRGGNFEEFRERMSSLVGAKYGNLAHVIRTGTVYTVPAVDAEKICEGIDNSSESIREGLMLEAHKARLKVTQAMQQQLPLMFEMLWAETTEVSKQVLKAAEGFSEARAESDGNKLWKLIKKTHDTSVVNVQLQDKYIEEQESLFHKMMQKKGETTANFKKQFDLQWARVKALEVECKSDAAKDTKPLIRLPPPPGPPPTWALAGKSKPPSH